MTEQQKLAAEDQKRKINQVLEYYRKGCSEIGLFGVGGTGKTQAAIEIVKTIQEEADFELTIIGAAISHGAKNVLKERLKDAPIDDCMTVARLLNLRRDFAEDGTEIFISAESHYYNKNGDKIIKKPPIFYADIIIIDECSQIGKDIYDLILKNKRPSSTIIYLGDWHQTPPVEEDKDLIKIELDSPTFDVAHQCRLTIPFRYEGDIQELATRIAEEIDKESNQNFLFIEDFVENEGKDYCFYRETMPFFKEFFKSVKNSTPDNLKDVVLVNYRNEIVTSLALKIRSKLKGTEDTSLYLVGDRIVCKRGNPNILHLENHKIFTVMEVKELTVNAMCNDKFGYIGIENYDTTTGSIKYPIDVFKLKLKDSNNRVIHDILVLRDPKDEMFLSLKKSFHNKATKALPEHKKQEWAAYYKFIDTFNTFNYAYSVNTYVVQGDTYNEVFVNLRDIMSVRPTTMRQKLQSFYTAVSRAQKKVHILI